jgi:hypothetical protein
LFGGFFVERENVLILFYYTKVASAMYDHIDSFYMHSKHNIRYINLSTTVPSKKELAQFDWIVIHYSSTVLADHCLAPQLKVMLRELPVKKAIFIQDEYRMVNDVINNIDFMRIDVVFTCVEESQWHKVYPKQKLPGVKLVNCLTGYVPDSLMNMSRRPYDGRPLDVVYRARKLSSWYGSLGREKWKIADKFNKDNITYGLKADVSYHEEDRIYGDQWIDFLSSSKAVLGCESGASVFDFTGNIQKKVEEYEKTHPEASYEEIEDRFFPGLDNAIYLNQISPRCFECAALGTIMILYEGNYSSILTPWKHFLPLKKDHSNMEELSKILLDPIAWSKVVDAAFDDIILSGKYSYKKFINKFDNVLDECSEDLAVGLRSEELCGTPAPEYKSGMSSKLFSDVICDSRLLKMYNFIANYFYNRCKNGTYLYRILKTIHSAFFSVLSIFIYMGFFYKITGRGSCLWSFWSGLLSFRRQPFHRMCREIAVLRFISYVNNSYHEPILGYQCTLKDKKIILFIDQKENISRENYDNQQILQWFQQSEEVQIQFSKTPAIESFYKGETFNIKHPSIIKWLQQSAHAFVGNLNIMQNSKSN